MGLGYCAPHWAPEEEEEERTEEPEAGLAFGERWILHRVSLTKGWLEGEKVQEPAAPRVEEAYEPRTDLGRELWALRQRAIASGARLLTLDEINAEVSTRRHRHRPDE